MRWRTSQSTSWTGKISSRAFILFFSGYVTVPYLPSPPPILCRLASESGLRLVYKRAFHEILQEEKDSRDFGPLLGKMGVLNEYGESAMDADQWEAASKFLQENDNPAPASFVKELCSPLI